ncbi:bidirectional sugar transporter SWEET7b-like [Argentina anserina]|uniref:bidirectional sugar transporter SWEET7b-like n=1 Tax=Argentina anserina TaxID=57926 RepID=UPI0021768E16|nr:bidirectional sugar transporter SWEET7b-like [Potentilla anserina]
MGNAHSGRTRTTLGVVGNVISACLFLSPVPTFKTIYQKKDVESFDPKPYLCTVLNCLLWCFYGMPFVNPNSILVVTINGAGLIMELIYLAIFCYYASKEGRRTKVIKTKSVEYMTPWLSLCNTLNGACWASYALIGKVDYFILLSNGLGFILGAIQLIIYGIYYRNSKPAEVEELDDDNKKLPAIEMQPAENMV